MKRITILALSFLIFSGVAHGNTENHTSTSSASTTPVTEAVSTSDTSGEVILTDSSTSTIDTEMLSLTFLERVGDVKKQLDAYVARIDLLNEKILSNVDKLGQSGFETSNILQIVAESNSALENAKNSLNNINQEETFEDKTFDEIITAISKTKNELGSAINEIRKAQEKGKIAVSELKILVLDN